MKNFILIIALLGVTVQAQLWGGGGGGGGGGDCSSGCPDFNCHKDMRCFSTATSKEAVLLPHTRCSKFYKCQAGFIACEFDCPRGLHFNKEEMVCDWPWLACCDPKLPCPEPCIPTKTCPPTVPPTTTRRTTTKRTTTKRTTTRRTTTRPPPPPPTPGPCSTGCPEFNCTKDIRCFSTIASKEAVLLPHRNCRKFYKCQSGFMACEFNCPKGLHFNKKKMVCDWPWLACCDDKIPCVDPCIPNVTCPDRTTTRRPKTTTRRPPPTTTPAPCTTQCPEINCYNDKRCARGPINKGEAILLPHKRCNKFYKCMNGSMRACEFDCPRGLHFNREKSVCDWPWFACCDPKVKCVTPCIPGITCRPGQG